MGILVRSWSSITSWLVGLPPAVVFLVIAGFVGLVFTCITPPFEVTDEASHLYRAYQISEGDIKPQVITTGTYGGQVPADLITFSRRLQGEIPFHTDHKFTLAQFRQMRHMQVGATQATVVFTNTAIYSPLPYVPQVVGIAAVRILPGKPNFMLLFYAARLLNLAAAIALVYWAIKKIPFGKWGLTVLFLTPMALFQFASVSSDAITYGLSAWTIAYSLSALYGERNLRRSTVILLLVTALAVALLRVPYALFAIAPIGALFVLLKRHVSGKKAWLIAVGLALICAVLILGWQTRFNNSAIHFTTDSTINQQAQLHTLFSIPHMLSVFVQTHFTGFHNIVVAGLIGVLGWLDTPLPEWAIVGYLLFLITSIFVLTPGETMLPSRWLRWTAVGLFAVAIMVIDVAEYLYWTPVNAPVILGIQGRYYLPLLTLLVVAGYGTIRLSQKDWRKFHLARLGFIGLVEVVSIVIVFNRYFVHTKSLM